ncbi:MAG: hypothetical protein E6R03_02300 [Hyphomicrobiaceae bacterium]|nr:MAG: hypothetical protein E6R03_02300 [Hyphomicrobiaceae bacterium]
MNINTPEPISSAQPSQPTTNSSVAAPASSQVPVAPPTQESTVNPIKQAGEFEKKFKDLSRRDAELVKREQMLQAQLQRASQGMELAELASKNPLEFLKRQGQDIHQVLEQHVKSTQESHSVEGRVSQLQDQIGKLTEALQQERQFRLDFQQREQKQAMRESMRTRLVAAGDQFELLTKAPQGLDAMFDLCKNYYGEDSSQWPIEEAAGLIEAELEKQASQLFQTYQGTKKLSKFFNSQPSVDPAGGTPPPPGQAPKVRYSSADVLDSANRIEDEADSPSAGDVMGAAAAAAIAANNSRETTTQEPLAQMAPSVVPQRTQARPTNARNTQTVHYKPALPPLSQSPEWERAKALLAKGGFSRPAHR